MEHLKEPRVSHLSFTLPDQFVNEYEERRVPWGFGTMSEVTFLRTYSRKKQDGTKERWFETCRRIIEGMYSIQRDWCEEHRIPWTYDKALRSAQEAYDRLFHFKWTPPGRGIWMMGTKFVHERRNSAPLQNCAFVSTDDLVKSMGFLMEASMLGVGVGFDTDGAGQYTIKDPDKGNPDYSGKHLAHGLLVKPPHPDFEVWPENFWAEREPNKKIIIEDTREGWVDSTVLLLRALLIPGVSCPEFDYSAIRPAGEDLQSFGGTAAGAGPLINLHTKLREIFAGRVGEKVTTTDVADIGNLIGKCVVAGNVRRSAEILLGQSDDQDFLDLKNAEVYPERNDYEQGWGHLSNNSVMTHVGNGTDYDEIAKRNVINGEPGLFYIDVARQYGRLVDPPNNADYRADGTNPCGEQTLESFECCTLVETYPTKCEDKADYLRTLKFAYLYAKTVTLLPTHWAETNAIMQRNRRIGCSMTGIAQFVETNTMTELREWQDEGYHEIQHWDNIYAEWLCVRESIKTTSVKPSGTVSLLAGVSPGVHWPTYGTYIRRMRFSWRDPIVQACEEAGYTVEPDVKDPDGTAVVEFPVRGLEGVRTEKDVSIWEKVALGALTQRYWADNQVSMSVTFRDTEAVDIPAMLHAYEGELKSLSLMPIFETSAEKGRRQIERLEMLTSVLEDEDAIAQVEEALLTIGKELDQVEEHAAYAQMPYEAITDTEYERITAGIKPLDLEPVYGGGMDAIGEKFCSNDTCEVDF